MAGIAYSTLENYFQNEEFQREYRKAVNDVLEAATRQAQNALAPTLDALLEIIQDNKAMKRPGTGNRVAAARAILEYSLKMTEFTDILREMEAPD